MAAPENIKEAVPRQGKKPPKKITEKYLYNAGLAYLQRFPASIPHFRRVMTRKIDKSCKYHTQQDRDACLSLLEKTIEIFARQGMLNDELYLQGMVNSLRRRGLSIRAIQAKLQQKGLEPEKITDAIRAFDGQEDSAEAELAAAVQYMRKKRLGCFGNKEARDKHLASLARGGFPFDIAQKALSLDDQEAQQILNTRPY